VIALVAGGGLALMPTAASASPAVTSQVAPVSYASVAPTPKAQAAVNAALAQVGKPYAWGAAGPSSFDCSGLTQYAYAAAGVSLPHSSGMQSRTGVPVGLWDMRPGDLLFFYSPVGHVGLYLGNGMMVHASTYGQPVSVVKASSVSGYVGSARLV
jgi:cell wall-associated NlpC family hydrolase